MQRPQVDEDVIVIRIRPSRSNDGPALRAIERSSGEQFRSIGMASVADDEPLSEDGLAVYAIDGRGWVAVDAADHPKGYVLVDEVDGNAHVAQISILPELQGHGVARALLDRVRIWATEAGCPAITLTTFNNVPWNRPLYEHLGFVVLSKEEIGPDLQVVVRDEANDGLDPDARVCMRVATNVSMIPDS